MVARWLVEAFFQFPDGYTAPEMTAMLLKPPPGPHETFVLLEAGQPAGTAAAVQSDLEARPDLTPWLAGVFVLRECRGRGHASALVRHVEAFAAASGVSELWLYTHHAETLYARLGWRRAGLERDRDRDAVLMRRALAPG